jgi:hypothetical protein
MVRNSYNGANKMQKYSSISRTVRRNIIEEYSEGDEEDSEYDEYDEEDLEEDEYDEGDDDYY